MAPHARAQVALLCCAGLRRRLRLLAAAHLCGLRSPMRLHFGISAVPRVCCCQASCTCGSVQTVPWPLRWGVSAALHLQQAPQSFSAVWKVCLLGSSAGFTTVCHMQVAAPLSRQSCLSSSCHTTN